jgi:hypothetical protein
MKTNIFKEAYNLLNCLTEKSKHNIRFGLTNDNENDNIILIYFHDSDIKATFTTFKISKDDLNKKCDDELIEDILKEVYNYIKNKPFRKDENRNKEVLTVT